MTESVPIGREGCHRQLQVEVDSCDVSIAYVARQQRLQLHRHSVRAHRVGESECVRCSDNHKVRLAVFQIQLVSFRFHGAYKDNYNHVKCDDYLTVDITRNTMCEYERDRSFVRCRVNDLQKQYLQNGNKAFMKFLVIIYS